MSKRERYTSQEKVIRRLSKFTFDSFKVFVFSGLTQKIKSIFFSMSVNINEMKTAVHSLRAPKPSFVINFGYLILFFLIFSCNCVPMVEMQAFEACDNISGSQVIGTVKASVPDGQPLTYRLTDNAGGLFEIGEDNGELSLASGRSLDYMRATQHTITVLVSNTVAIGDTSTADFQINVITAPLLGSNSTYVLTYQSNASMMLGNSGGKVNSFTLSNALPAGLEFINNNGQLSLQGTPSAVTLDESNDIISVPVEIKAQNSCGSNTARAMITVNPIFVSGDQSPGIVHADHPSVGDNDNSLIYSATNIPFASGGTGAYNDPVIIAISNDATNHGATNISIVL